MTSTYPYEFSANGSAYVWQKGQFALVPTPTAPQTSRPTPTPIPVAFLASDKARWLTGQLLFAGGGHRMV